MAVVERAETVGTSTQIVPGIRLREQWWVLAALGLLVSAIVSHSYWYLHFVHVFSGLLWTGTDLFMGFVIGPILRRVDPPTRRTMTMHIAPRMLFLMPTLSTLTSTSGWYLANEFGFAAVDFPARWWMYGAYALAGLLTINGLGMLLPTNVRVYRELRKEHPDVARINRLMGRYVQAVALQGLMQVGIIIVMTKIATGF